MAGTVIVITTEEKVREVPLKGDTLHFLYEQIGCSTVDCVRLADGLDMWVDDEGLYTSEVNWLATMLAHTFGFLGEAIYGDVVLADGNSEGETIALSDEALFALIG
jgi:hypothetical protein